MSNLSQPRYLHRTIRHLSNSEGATVVEGHMNSITKQGYDVLSVSVVPLDDYGDCSATSITFVRRD